MHPLMMTALAREVERERRRGPRHSPLRSLALANRIPGSEGSAAASRSRRRLVAGIRLRPGLS